MILYHFTSRHHEPMIRREGLTLGRLIWRWEPPAPVEHIGPLQWLTRNAEWEQGWCGGPDAGSMLPYRRNDWRITVEIPQELQDRLISWVDYCARRKPPMADMLNKVGGQEEWLLFDGNVPADCLKVFDRHPKFHSLEQAQPQLAHALKQRRQVITKLYPKVAV